jgi:hypothetical protein
MTDFEAKYRKTLLHLVKSYRKITVEVQYLAKFVCTLDDDEAMSWSDLNYNTAHLDCDCKHRLGTLQSISLTLKIPSDANYSYADYDRIISNYFNCLINFTDIDENIKIKKQFSYPIKCSMCQHEVIITDIITQYVDVTANVAAD